ncbi:MAG: prephenate dehydrogenase/arogenate dehydrogenase family protein [Chloroflexi bacterium]|nr:prephenate dehydrogenase/arogenate dehydrogenase family protein [Chloroflexota bacterium]
MKRAKIKAEIVGYSREYRNAQQARKMGAVDRAVRSAEEAVEGADLVVVATPPTVVRDVFQQIAPHLMEDCVVTDVTSVKAPIMAWAEEILPSTAHFVGGHPMAGRESSGIDAADVDLFRGCIYCVTPASSAHGQAVRVVVDMAVAVGGVPRFLDPTEHDAFVAGVSHLPFLVSIAMTSATTGDPSWREMSPLAASGYRDISRLASGDPTMHRDICMTNAPNIIRWIDSFAQELQKLRRLIDDGETDALLEAFQKTKAARDLWLVRPSLEEEAPPAPIESSADQMSAMLFGHIKWPDFSKRAAGGPQDQPGGDRPSRR